MLAMLLHTAAALEQAACAAERGAPCSWVPDAGLSDLPDSDVDDADVGGSADDDIHQAPQHHDAASGPPVDLRFSVAELFPAPPQAHDAACVAVLRSCAAAVPLAWSRASHCSHPPSFRASARAAALALHRRGVPPPLVERIVALAARATLWPGVQWVRVRGATTVHEEEQLCVARFIGTPAPASLDELAAAQGTPLACALSNV